ncbi:glycosyltransferase family 2 protein, partial [Kineococcus siccus]|uniref:glycosyltransferase family 2 protein n=1 Tax=Kineococcus siccus TaxID=2696567 RepID=UPI00196A1FE5
MSRFDPAYPYEEYSRLTGEPRAWTAADRQVAFRPLTRGWRSVAGRVLVLAAIACELVFVLWLLHPSHFPVADGSWLHWVSMASVASIGVIELLRLLNVTTLALATVNAREVEPLLPSADLRVAFLTTIVPSKEPIDLARRTLLAALEVRHAGPYDVWLLDEGDDPAVRALCAELGVHHFSRKGVARWNQPSGTYKAKTKHGNYNAWLEAAGDRYDVWVSVDTDHVPLPNFVERLVGYFADPDVAFVVGPQVYGNYDNVVTRGAESQQYLFHSVLQRAANRCGAAMFVGTNNAVRLSALREIGGLQDSITEDAATSLEWHARRNPATGRPWRSVYTADVLAVGEGPTSWGDYFTQQQRWAQGTDEVLLRSFPRLVRALPLRRLVHYGLLMSYYPSAAVSWVLGMFNIVAYLLTGAGGVVVATQLWLALYVNAAALQVGIYFWNRHHNVSPHEEEGSSGVSGMVMSVLAAPLYVNALFRAVTGRRGGFTITPKGSSSSVDGVRTFRMHLSWAALLVVALGVSEVLGHDHPMMRFWAYVALLVCLLPPFLSTAARLRRPPAPRVVTLPRVPNP